MNNTDLKELRGKHSRRRHPRRRMFLKGMIIYVVLALVVIAALSAIGWRYAELRADALPERKVEQMISDNNSDSWRRIMTAELPKTFYPYENSRRLADEILSPCFSVNDVTYIRYASKAGDPEFLLIGDGIPMAELTLKQAENKIPGLGEWSVERIEFLPKFFEHMGVGFKQYEITLPVGAELTVNGVKIDRDASIKGYDYPGLLPCEAEIPALAPTEKYILDGFYFEPQISASLNGSKLALYSAQENNVIFSYPESSLLTVSATVPSGVTVMLNGVKLDNSFATLTYTDGFLDEMDDGGDGNPPPLEVWTVSGLFAEPKVEASYGDTALSLLSSDNGNYLFKTPSECRFTLTVILPHGARATANGRPLDSAETVSAGELIGGKTLIGAYGAKQLAAISLLPAFDKYTVSGFLAHPKVTAELDGAELKMAGTRTEGYSIICEFDFPHELPNVEASTDMYGVCENFAREYLTYSLSGGEMGNNYLAFDEKYGKLLSSLPQDSMAYLRLMQTYSNVYKRDSFDNIEITALNVTECIGYSEKCVSVKLDASVLLSDEKTNERPEPDKAEFLGSLYILLTKQSDQWTVRGYVDDMKSVN